MTSELREEPGIAYFTSGGRSALALAAVDRP
jgi:hypothetical protein